MAHRVISSIFAMPAMQDRKRLAPLLSESEALEKQANQVAESVAKGEDDNGDVLKATNHACMHVMQNKRAHGITEHF